MRNDRLTTPTLRTDFSLAMAAAFEPAERMAASALNELSLKTCADRFAGDSVSRARPRKTVMMTALRRGMGFSVMAMVFASR